MFVYFNNQFLSLEDVSISPFDRGFLFADGVYEALRTYNGKLFRLDDHLKRLEYSLKELELTFHNFDMIEKICNKLVDINNIKTDYSVYLQISRGVSFPRTHYYEENLSPNVFAYVKPIKNNSKEFNEGIKVILEKDLRWLRCDIKSTSLLPAVMANQKAIACGAYEAILYRDDFVTEGTHTNFFAVKNEIVYTTPLSNFILSGATRTVVLELCAESSIPCKEEYIKINELKNFDEFFITGTTTEITPAVQIDDWKVSDGKPGKMTRKIQSLFLEATKSF